MYRFVRIHTTLSSLLVASLLFALVAAMATALVLWQPRHVAAQSPSALAPGKLAIYYGFPSSVNGASGNIEAAVATLRAYDVVVFGDTLQLPEYDPNDPNRSNPFYDKACTQNSHYDHNNTVAIIQQLTLSGVDVFGYISIGGENTNRICPTISPLPMPLTQAEIEHSVDLWKAMGVTGVFYDEAGYDFGTDRARQNAAVDYAHSQGLRVFINAFAPEDIFEPAVVGAVLYVGQLAGQTSTIPMNPLGASSHLGSNDLSLLESFQIIRGEYANPVDWVDRSDKAMRYRRQFGTQFATVTTAVDEAPDCGFDQSMFDYAWWSTLLYGFDFMGWGEGANYSAAGNCNGQLPWRSRPSPTGTGDAFTSPQVAHALTVHSRQTSAGRIEVDDLNHSGQFVAGAPAPPGGEPVAPEPGLIHWWPGDNSAQDSVGFSHGALTVGKSWFAPGRVGPAFSFDGRDDFIAVGSDASITGTGPFSVDAWIRTTDDRGVIVQQRGSNYNGQYVLSVGGLWTTDPGKVCWGSYGADQFGFDFCSTVAVNDGAWHHVAGTREVDGTGRIYIDGVLNASQPAPARPLVPLEVYIGADKRDNVAFFSGLIDEVAISNQALSLEEVSAIFSAGSAGRIRPVTHGVWVFSDEISTLAARDTLIQRSAASGVSDLYLSVYRSIPNSSGRRMAEDSDMADLIAKAHSEGIHLWAAYGAPDWPVLGCAAVAFPMQRMSEVTAYNAANPSNRFDGVILDVEPTEPQSDSSYRSLLGLYQCTLDALKPSGLGLQTAIRFFWDGVVEFPAATHTSQRVYEHVLDMDVHRVVVMGYRDFAGPSDCTSDGIVCLDREEVGYAASQGRPAAVLAGIETQNCAPGCGPEKVTFFEEGMVEMNREAGGVVAAFAAEPSFGGFAIHRYAGAYLGGATGWGQVNPGFPAPRDTTPPDISASAAKAESTIYDAGTWANQAVTVHFTCSDTGSGVASCPADQVLSADGVTPSVSGTATDYAGNSASASFGPIWIDKTAPGTSITAQPPNPSPSADASFAFSGDDATSGVARFECSLDNAPFAICISPQNYNGLANGDHTFQARTVDYAENADTTPASAAWSVQTQPVTVAVVLKVGDTDGIGHAGYLVRVYSAAGREIANAWSSSDGRTTFQLTSGSHYEFLVEKNGARSGNVGFVPSAGQTLEYRLARITVNVGKPGYLVRIYNGAGRSGSEWGNAWSDANGNASFFLLEGDYEFLVEKNGARSAKTAFSVAAGGNQTLTYTLSATTVNVGKPGYLVRIYNGAGRAGSEWGNAWSDANGNTTFFLLEGDYSFLVEKNGARSAKTAFSVAAGGNQTLSYTLSATTVSVGKPGYLVRIYNGAGGSGLEWGNAWSDANGNTTFFLVEGDYGFLVEKNGARSAKTAFSVAAGGNQTLTYTLSSTTVSVGKPGYLVRIYNGAGGSGSEWGNAWSDTNGNTTFFLVEGDYGFLVEKNGARSAKTAFSVAAGGNQTLTYALATITIHVQNSAGQPLLGYLVRIYNLGAGEWGNASTAASGDAEFYLVDGCYQYQVEKGADDSGVEPTEGFTVLAGSIATYIHSTP